MEKQITVNKFALGEYSEQQRQNWKQNARIVFYKDDEQFQDFVVQSLTDKTFNKKMYFGFILQDLSDRIKTETGIDTYLFRYLSV